MEGHHIELQIFKIMFTLSFCVCLKEMSFILFSEYIGHSHMTFATVDHASDGGYMIKPLKQKQMVDGLCYLLQEIYGIENKACAAPKVKLNKYIDYMHSASIICSYEYRVFIKSKNINSAKNKVDFHKTQKINYVFLSYTKTWKFLEITRKHHFYISLFKK